MRNFPRCARCDQPVTGLRPRELPTGSIVLHEACNAAAHRDAMRRLLDRMKESQIAALAAQMRTRAAAPSRPTCRWAVFGVQSSGQKVGLSASYGDRDAAVRHRDLLLRGGVEGYSSIEVEAVKDVF